MQPNHPSRRRTDDGFAMPSVIAGMFIILVLLTGVTAMVTRDLRDSSRTTGLLEARGSAEAGLDELYSRLLADPNYLDSADLLNHPAYANVDPDRLAQIDENGLVVPCAFDGAPCYQVTVSAPQTFATQVNGADADYLPGSLAVSIQSHAWAKCVNDSVDRCFGESRYEGTLRRRTFLEYVILADSEAVDPIAFPDNRTVADGGEIDGNPCDEPDGTRDADCVVAAYQSDGTVTDRVVGPIHTNDSVLTVCGAPEFGAVEVNYTVSPSSTGWRYAAAPICTTQGTPSQDLDGAGPGLGEALDPIPGGVLSLPISTSDDSALNCATGEVTGSPNGTPDYFEDVKCLATNDGLALAGDATVEFTGSTLIVDGAIQDLPDAGVIYTDGDVEVRGGTLDGQLSIVAAGRIRITGDILYADDDTDPSDGTQSNDVLGLNAGGNIVIEYPGGLPGESRDMTIHAAMLSVGNSVSVDKWATSDWENDDSIALPGPPTLTIKGAISGRYRGVFGAYDDGLGATGTEGRLISGFAKDFEYDQRLASTLQPPYFVAPERAAWSKVGVRELPTGG